MYFSDKPNEQEEKFIIDQLWEHNEQYNAVDIRSLVVTRKSDKGKIIAGSIARTWWRGLEIQYLWVDKHHRKKGFGKQLMTQAEKEATNRGCHFAYVDTFSFQSGE
ncbi:GNAT family N-acetyltransferase [Candidatus Regiella insecticola]|uniref:Putative acetyltransferase n=1 Tax=Candidatus Regiella insecticola TaxID=138073 RepID=A0A6L2ZP30_9ENTR|nr:GNAT family N-acetyltransferase [Candidatus Regiella insecticola]GFN46543.1 putative acetyltransferase [Candidatus Regiella insecticola]